ncbi:hypothetical protein [Chitinophaga sp. sic0106]|uniref:hypothetical protein n=1 Tax=Chitinophaga sp. sic0106 TaxID=2854785 RepID=UPI001C45C900|nr:hypothetical protein [Chitinophaga sp. sic0106]MBV7534035.1 hypothetical protein [Chitinophaga sp. sic0106]
MQKITLGISIALLTACGTSNYDLNSFKSISYYEKCRRVVLAENVIGKEYFFSRSGNEIDELNITYLGYIVQTNGDSLRVLNCINYTGQNPGSRRGNGKVYIYDIKNGNFGFYSVGSAKAVPSRVEKGDLIFDTHYDDCNAATRIRLSDSIPKEIFINCNKEGGDIYSFENSVE